jgi:hypothetical protein
MSLQMLPTNQHHKFAGIRQTALDALRDAGVDLSKEDARRFGTAILRRHAREDWPELLMEILPRTAPGWYAK